MLFISKLFRAQSQKNLNQWLDEYKPILLSRPLKPKTIEIKNYLLKFIDQEIGHQIMRKITPMEISRIIKIFTDDEKNSMAKCLYHLAKDIFREAQANGWIDRNPVEPLKPPKSDVKRSRMTLREFKKMLNAAKASRCEYLYDAMLLALITGQRRSDIVTMKKTDVKRNHLRIIQYKTRERIAIPLKIKCNKINMTLQQMIEKSKYDYLVNQNGDAISVRQITQSFGRIRDKTFHSKYWKDSTPFTFHEIRSLSERLYREQKIDTKTLLGHKSQQTTDLYNDSRGKEFKYLKIKI